MARRMPTAPCLALALWPILQACTTSDNGAPLVTRYDSAGIRIVESYRRLWGDSSHWQVDPEPLMDLAESGTGDPHIFYSVLGIKRLSDGSIVVANRGSGRDSQVLGQRNLREFRRRTGRGAR